MNQEDSAEAEEIKGAEPTLVIVDEAQGIYEELTEKDVLELEVEELMKMSSLLDGLKGSGRRGSPKVNDKKRTRAKSKKARISRRANRG